MLKPAPSQQKIGILDGILLLLLLTLLIAGFIKLWLTQQIAPLARTSFIASPLKASWSEFLTSSSLDTFSKSPNNRMDTAYQAKTSLLPVSFQIVNGFNKNLNENDSMVIRYQGNAQRSIFNCYGVPLTPQQITEQRIYINNQKELVCQPLNEAPPLDKPNVLIENIEALFIRYGEDLDRDGKAERFVAADVVDFRYGQVVALQLNMLLKTNELITNSTGPQYYTIVNTELGPYQDNYLRKIISITIPLKPI